MNKYRVWDKIIPKTFGECEEDKPTGMMIGWDYAKKSDYLKDGLNGKYPIMRYADLEDSCNIECCSGDLRKLNGKIYKIVDHDWRFVFERNLVEFGENEMITLDEDTAYLSEFIGTIYDNPELMRK